jgi:hypothetical protein
MSNTIPSIGAASYMPARAVTSKNETDGDHDNSGTSASAKVGPAVIVNLSNSKAPDAAQGDPDHDGK